MTVYKEHSFSEKSSTTHLDRHMDRNYQHHEQNDETNRHTFRQMTREHFDTVWNFRSDYRPLQTYSYPNLPSVLAGAYDQ